MSKIILKCHSPKSLSYPARDWVNEIDSADAIDAVDTVKALRDRGCTVIIEGDVIAYLAASERSG